MIDQLYILNRHKIGGNIEKGIAIGHIELFLIPEYEEGQHALQRHLSVYWLIPDLVRILKLSVQN